MTPEPTSSAEGGKDPTGVLSVDDIAKIAQDRLATITGLVESAKASAAAVAECQALIATALADAQSKLAEMSTAATQAAAAKTQVANEQSAIVESAKTAAAAVAESQARATAALADAQAKLNEITSAATQAVAAKTAITDDQAVIATKSDHIQKAQEHADKVRADLDRTLTAATQQATEAEGSKTRALSAADNTTTILADIRATKGAAETEAAAVVTFRQTAEESAAVTKSLADKSAIVESRIADYEKRLAELETQSVAQLKTIESLLPGATGAGLAHAFNERRKGFLKPHDRWQWFFIGSVSVIVILAVSGLWHVYHLERVPTYDELVRLWLARLPVAGALLWLALHASRESALAKRLEEDYGYKAAVASCLEGFQKQMSQFGKDVEPNSPLARLLNNTLTTIASPPGRIYDKHQLVVSPIDELKDATKTVAEAVKPVAEAAKALKPLG